MTILIKFFNFEVENTDGEFFLAHFASNSSEQYESAVGDSDDSWTYCYQNGRESDLEEASEEGPMMKVWV